MGPRDKPEDDTGWCREFYLAATPVLTYAR